MSAFKSGLLLFAAAISNLGMKALTNRIFRRFGFRTVSIVNVTLASLVVMACGLLSPSLPLAVILIVVFCYGMVRSMQFATLSTLAYADIPPQQMSAANTLWSAASVRYRCG
jgi:fucose permease